MYNAQVLEEFSSCNLREQQPLAFCGQHLSLLCVFSLEALCPGSLERSNLNQICGVLLMVLQNGDCRLQMFCICLAQVEQMRSNSFLLLSWESGLFVSGASSEHNASCLVSAFHSKGVPQEGAQTYSTTVCGMYLCEIAGFLLGPVSMGAQSPAISWRCNF